MNYLLYYTFVPYFVNGFLKEIASQIIVSSSFILKQNPPQGACLAGVVIT